VRLLHVVPTYLPATRYGGPIYAVHGLCRALAARGHDVDVFTTNVDGASESDVPLDAAVMMGGVSVRYFRSTLRRLYVSPSMRNALRTAIPTYDAIHLHSVFLWPTYVAARIAAAAGVPYVISPRGMLVPELIRKKSSLAKSAWIAMVEKRNFRESSGIHFTAQREWDDARRLSIPLPHPFVVPNGIDPLPPRPTARRNDTLLVLGRISWKKGIDRLLDAMTMLPSVNAVIAGNDEEELTPRLRAQAERNGVGDRVEFRGPVSGDAKDDLLRTATALVLPSLSENFGNVVLEAMAAELPVIVTPEVGLAGDVTSAGAGIVTSGDPEPLAAAIRTLLDDGATRAAMGKRGRELVNARFTWERVASRMEEHYERIAAERR
jgi:glycosyltransferase involved in cell wall biosynthesis